MGVLRGLLFDNIGLKLAALLLAVVVYVGVFTERPATMVLSFPFQITDIADTLTLVGEVPPPVQAELRGTGKQLIRLWLTEPRIKVSLGGIGPGRVHRTIGPDDLPLMPGDKLEIQRLAGTTELEIILARKTTRRVAVAPRVAGTPRVGTEWTGEVLLEPTSVAVTGPQNVVATLDSVTLEPISIEGRKDTLRAFARPESLPAWCSIEPPAVAITVPVQPH
jgi:hypothetical protein